MNGFGMPNPCRLMTRRAGGRNLAGSIGQMAVRFIPLTSDEKVIKRCAKKRYVNEPININDVHFRRCAMAATCDVLVLVFSDSYLCSR